ncbi:hypothetical protein HHUSO_G23095 [Huso huso]|uniref:Uncharacterized protein n=1 Tax=Huso huso TaxID=61971 RepID=A0ABR0YVY7_HUSHU
MLKRIGHYGIQQRNFMHCFQETPYHIHAQGSRTSSAPWDSTVCSQTFIFQVAYHKGSPGIHEQHPTFRLLFTTQRCPSGSNVHLGLLQVSTMWRNYLPEPVIRSILRPLIGDLHRQSQVMYSLHLKHLKSDWEKKGVYMFIYQKLIVLFGLSFQLSVNASDGQQPGSRFSHFSQKGKLCPGTGSVTIFVCVSFLLTTTSDIRSGSALQLLPLPGTSLHTNQGYGEMDFRTRRKGNPRPWIP